MTSTWVTVGGLALAAFLALVAARPAWFADWRVARRHGRDDVSGYTRLGDMSTGSVRALYSVLAVFFLVATLAVRVAAVGNERCEVAREVYESARAADGWRSAAQAEGMELSSETTRTRTGGSWTTHTVSESGRVVASWADAGGVYRFECER